MTEFASLDRCAAYVSVRTALEAVHRVTPAWPADLAKQAKRAALEAVMATAESTSFGYATPGRRRCVRAAISSAIDLAAVCDIAKAVGIREGDLDEALRSAGHAIALLGLLFHASASPFLESERPPRSAISYAD